MKNGDYIRHIMNLSDLKKYAICVWWAVLFLLKYDLAPVPKTEYTDITANLSLEEPFFVLHLDEND